MRGGGLVGNRAVAVAGRSVTNLPDNPHTTAVAPTPFMGGWEAEPELEVALPSDVYGDPGKVARRLSGTRWYRPPESGVR